MLRFRVSGMSCAACAAAVERAVSSVEGVSSCAVSLLTGTLTVEGSAAPEAVSAAVARAGYRAAAAGSAPAEADPFREAVPALKKRLLWSLIFLLFLLYLSMGHMFWAWPLPEALEGSHAAQGLCQLLLSAAVLIINQNFFVSGFKALLRGAPTMDTLVALGAGASFAYSTGALFVMVGASRGAQAGALMDELYFESAAMILTLISVGRLLEAGARGRTGDALRELLRLAPRTAVLERAGGEVRVAADEVRPGDIFLLRPGDSVPVDGEVISGGGTVDEQTLTGESVPVEKSAGSGISAATLNVSGFLRCRALKVGGDTTFARILELVSSAQATRAPIARLADRTAAVFVPAVIALALLTAAVWFGISGDAGLSLVRAVAVLVISCPCALGLATPVAIMAGSGRGARAGILFKTALALEQTGRARTVALDKTGTVTEGRMCVRAVRPAGDLSAAGLLALAGALEAGSEHPLGRAVAARARCEGLSLPECRDFTALPGRGVCARLGADTLTGGSPDFISSRIKIDAGVSELARGLALEGQTPLVFARNERILGVIGLADRIREDSARAVEEFRDLGLEVVMLTGDNELTAAAAAREAGVSRVRAGLLPADKAAAVGELKRAGPLIMAGDGVNDAPALAGADVGVALGSGTDAAIASSDIVLMKGSLRDLARAVRLSRAVLRVIRQNLFWAFGYNLLGIPLAAGCLAPLGLSLNPVFAAAAMALSSFCVVTNALRLNRISLEPGAGAAPRGALSGVRVSVEGMMCEHCRRRVREALAGLEEVSGVEVDLEAGEAVLTLKEGGVLTLEKLQRAVGGDYTVRGLRRL